MHPAAESPARPAPDVHGNFPAVEYARVSIARGVIRDRTRAGLTQQELARRAGIRFETLRRLESGRHTPSAATARLERALKSASRKPKA